MVVMKVRIKYEQSRLAAYNVDMKLPLPSMVAPVLSQTNHIKVEVGASQPERGMRIARARLPVFWWDPPTFGQSLRSYGRENGERFTRSDVTSRFQASEAFTNPLNIFPQSRL